MQIVMLLFTGRPTDIAHLVSANLNNKSNTDGIKSVGKIPNARANDMQKMQNNNISKSQENCDFPTKRQNDKLKSVSLDNHLINNGINTYPIEKRVKLIRIPSYPKSLESEFEKDITRQLIEMEKKGKTKNLTPGPESLTEVIQQTYDDSINNEKLENNDIESVDDVTKVLDDEKEEYQGDQLEHEITDTIKINDVFINEETVEEVHDTDEIKNGPDEVVMEMIDEKQNLEVIKMNKDFIKEEYKEKEDNTGEYEGDVTNGLEEDVAEEIEDKPDPKLSVEADNIDTECRVYVEDAIEKDDTEVSEDPQDPAKSDEDENIDTECKANAKNGIEKDDADALKDLEELSKRVKAENKFEVENGLKNKDAETLEELKQIVEVEAFDTELKDHVEVVLENNDTEEMQELRKRVEAERELEHDAEKLLDTQEIPQSVKASDIDTDIKDEMKEAVKEVKEDEKESVLITYPEQIYANRNDDDIKEGSNENLNQECAGSDAKSIVAEVADQHEESNSSIINETKTLLDEENNISIISDVNSNKEEQIFKQGETEGNYDNFKEITTSFIHHEKLLADNLIQTKHHDKANNIKISDEEQGSNQDEDVFFKAITNAANTLLSSQKISLENLVDVADTLNEYDSNENNSGNTSTLLEDIISINNMEKNDVIQIMHASVDNSSDKVSVREKRSISIQEYDPEIGIGNRSSFANISENDLNSLDTQKTDTYDDDVFIANEDSSIPDVEKIVIVHGDDTILINETLVKSAPSVLNGENITLDVQSPAIGDDVVSEDVVSNSEVNLQGKNTDISENIIQDENKNQNESNVVEAINVDVITVIEKQTEPFTNGESYVTLNNFEKRNSEQIENSEPQSKEKVNITPEPGATLKTNENWFQHIEESVLDDQNKIESVKNEPANNPEYIEINAEGGEEQISLNEFEGTLDLTTEFSPKQSEQIKTDTVKYQLHNLENAILVDLEVKSMSENIEEDKNSNNQTKETNVKSEERDKDTVIQKEEAIIPIKEEGNSKDTIPVIEEADIVTDTITIESSKHEHQNSKSIDTLIDDTSEDEINKSQTVTVENEFVKPNTESEKEQNESPYFADGNNILEKASILIQKVYRGFRVRKNLPKPLVEEDETQISAQLSKVKSFLKMNDKC